TDGILKELSSLVLQFTIFISIIISSMFPMALSVVIRISSTQSLLIGGIGLGGTISITIILFLIPQYQLHKILVSVKEKKITELPKVSTFFDNIILGKFREMRQSGAINEEWENMALFIDAERYLNEQIDYLQKNFKVWAFQHSSLVKVILSLFLPITTFVLQVIFGI
ncbi:MAG: hypothetical protein MUO76_06510, partial [Anaerolineaceae bacterium]|nr:hypothetical protein [Anaerolineaceae bacterium]